MLNRRKLGHRHVSRKPTRLARRTLVRSFQFAQKSAHEQHDSSRLNLCLPLPDVRQLKHAVNAAISSLYSYYYFRNGGLVKERPGLTRSLKKKILLN